MLAKEFQAVLERQWGYTHRTLVAKAVEYASDTDVLSNFKTAAALQHITPEQALTGMLAKHIVSIFNMVGTTAEYPSAVWDEKITDAINYLILLQGLLAEHPPKPQDPFQEPKPHA